MLEQITPVILTYNEELNIARVLSRLTWAKEVIVVDSVSTDATHEICSQFPNVRIVERPFDNHSNQWNFGLKETEIATEWVLALDADYVLPDDLLDEISRLDPPTSVAGYRMKFRFCIGGKPLSGSLYPPVTTLYRRDQAHYIQDGHTQRVVIKGEVNELKEPALLDDRKPLARWLAAQERYAELECKLLLQKKWKQLGWQDKLRKLIFVTPFLVPVYCLTIGKGIFDGWRGIFYALQRGVAEMILSLKMIEAKIPSKDDENAN